MIETNRVRVALAERSYDVVIGSRLLEDAGALIAAALGPTRRLAVVTDGAVAATQLPRFLASQDRTPPVLTLPAGETTKSWPHLQQVVEWLLALPADRKTVVVALGGGVVGDLAGFAAAITLRGLDVVQIPTTLLSQVDSSVGGKTAINAAAGKNLVGAFHQPMLVLADIDCLGTLPPRDLRSGYAEAVKHAVINDAAFFDWLCQHGPRALAGDAEVLERIVRHSVATKAAIVAADEREADARALLNLGHTFGHALEAETGFGDQLRHGEAVAIGMGLALDLSAVLLGCPTDAAQRLRSHLHAVGLPTTMAEVDGAPFDPDRLLAHMQHDKKTANGALTFVLATDIGAAKVVKAVDPAIVRSILAA
ncbi:MAG: 3-dehydroquinate synthase [Alphaproteobacteria bacterium]|nr:3-dehydroquinate synthase [Alphaproteobacteria bacterium]